MENFPAFLILTDKPCLVVGGGAIAARKTKQLLKANARVTVVAPVLDQSLDELKQSNQITHLAKKYEDDCLNDMCLVIVATDDEALNSTIAEHAKSQNILVNVVDNPKVGTFIMPSVIDRAPVMIAISTGGTSPVLARLLRARLEAMIPASYGKLAEVIVRFRDKVKKQFPQIRERRRFWEHVLQGSVAEMLYAGQDKRAMSLLEKKLQEDFSKEETKGEVYLVGGGPGDPDLLTFRALRLIQQADVVLYDRLVAPAII